MPRKGRSNEEIVHALHQVEGGEKVTEVCRRLGRQRADVLPVEEAVRRPRPVGAARAAVAAPRKQQVEAGRGRLDARSPHPPGDRPKKAVKPRARCTLAEWAQTAYRLSQRRAARLIPVRLETLRYRSTRDRQDALRQRLRELAAVRVRFGYRRLTVLLKREGWRVNAKRIYRLYGDEGLTVRTKPRKQLASRARVPLPAATRPNERWSMDFVSARLADGRWFRTLTVLDLYTRESLALVADRSLTGVKVAAALSRVLQQRDGAAGDHRRQRRRVRQPRDGRVGVRARRAARFHSAGQAGGECLHRKLQWEAARRMLEQPRLRLRRRSAARSLDAWRDDYNHVRPHSSLQDRTPAAVGAMWVDSREPRESTAVEEDRDRTRDRRSLRDYFAVVVLRGGSAGRAIIFKIIRKHGGRVCVPRRHNPSRTVIFSVAPRIGAKAWHPTHHQYAPRALHDPARLIGWLIF